MFSGNGLYSRLLSIAGALLLIVSCGYLPLTPSPEEGFYLKFEETGGYVGVSNVFVVNENASVTYDSRDYKFSAELENQDREKILQSIYSNNFFILLDRYFPKGAMSDVLIYTITFKTGDHTKKVTGYGGEFPTAMNNIIETLREVIEDLKNKLNSGRIVVTKEWIWEEWKFGGKLRLADHVHKKVFVGKEIFDHFKDRFFKGLKVVYSEDGWIYRISTNGAFAIPFEEHDGFYVKVQDGREPFPWLPEIETKLADIPPEGIMIYDANYRKIRNHFSSTYYPWYFIDGDIADGEPVYKIHLLHGNNE